MTSSSKIKKYTLLLEEQELYSNELITTKINETFNQKGNEIFLFFNYLRIYNKKEMITAAYWKLRGFKFIVVHCYSIDDPDHETGRVFFISCKDKTEENLFRLNYNDYLWN